MKIAIIGTGISGMAAAYLLAQEHEVTVFEANDRLGGHTNTVEVDWNDRAYAVDTGFIVFNDRTYPNFMRLIDRLGVAWQPSDMSFSVHCDRSGLEYNGSSLNQLFAQRRNLLRPSFYRMIADVMRFNREAPALLDTDDANMTLGKYLETNNYSSTFINHYIVPMGSAIWSADPATLERIPARFFIQFFNHHGLLTLKDRPQWRVIRGGSHAYIGPLTAPYQERIRLNAPIERVQRYEDRVEVTPRTGAMEQFDEVIIAAHSNEALGMLADSSDEERTILGDMPYQRNEAILHVDRNQLPLRKNVWASWNYHIPTAQQDSVAVTYYMNRLQGFDAPVPFCVTLNPAAAIDPQYILRRITYHHPVFTPKTIVAQSRHSEISGRRRTHYCGAYWGFGFHEDGVNSALRVCRRFGLELT